MKKFLSLLLSSLFILAPGVQAATNHAGHCKSNQSYNSSSGMCVTKSSIGIAGG